MTLYLKYRPKELEQIVGNEETVAAVREMVKKNCPHAILFHGPTGCGKTTLARIIAEKLGCKGNDLTEVDSADFRGIDTIRGIRKQSQFAPLSSPCRVWIIDECHRLTGDAQSALLKILEDTPKHVYFILCTTEPQKLLPTIRGRCSQFQMQTLSEQQIFKLLRSVVKAEGERLQRKVYWQIAQDSLGHPRNALQILDQVLRVPAEQRLEAAKKSAEEQSKSIELCRALLQARGWKEVAMILKGLQNQDAEGIRRHVLAYCNSVLLNESNDRAAAVLEVFQEPTYNTGMSGITYACYCVVKGG